MPNPSTVDSGTSNASVGTDGQAIPTSSTLVGASDGTNLQQLLVESSSNPNERVAIYSGANKWGIDSSSKGPVKAAAGDIVDLATLAAIVSSNKAAVKSATGDIVDLATLAGAVRAEDAASADGHTGIVLLAVRKATPANTSGTDGDYEFLQISGGRLWTSAVIDTALPTGSNVIGALSANQSINNAQVAGTTVDTNSGNKSAGTQRVVLATDQPALTTPMPTTPQVSSSGGSVPYHNLSAASTNFTNVKGSACQMYSCRLSNTSGSTINIKFYDKATSPGTGDTPKTTIQMPANTIVLGAFPEGMKFSNGFGWAATAGVADNDNAAIGANCIIDFSLNS